MCMERLSNEQLQGLRNVPMRWAGDQQKGRCQECVCVCVCAHQEGKEKEQRILAGQRHHPPLFLPPTWPLCWKGTGRVLAFAQCPPGPCDLIFSSTSPCGFCRNDSPPRNEEKKSGETSFQFSIMLLLPGGAVRVA